MNVTKGDTYKEVRTERFFLITEGPGRKLVMRDPYDRRRLFEISEEALEKAIANGTLRKI